MTPAEIRTLSVLVFIISLLTEHSNFDAICITHPGKKNRRVYSIVYSNAYPLDLALELRTITEVGLSSAIRYELNIDHIILGLYN